MAEKLADVGDNLALFKVHVDELREQDINARVMPPEMFERLTETIKGEGRLEQLPFTVFRGDHFEMVSGHHRLRAARAAQLTEIFVLADTRPLSKSKVRAKQIAHNRISGEDDPATLKRIFDEIESVEDQLESYLRAEDFDDVKQLDPASIVDISVGIPWKHLTLVFVPSTLEALERIEKIIRRTPKDTDILGLVNVEVVDRFRNVALKLGRTEDVRSLGAIITRMAEITEKHLAEVEAATPAVPDAASVAKGRRARKVAQPVGGAGSNAGEPAAAR